MRIDLSNYGVWMIAWIVTIVPLLANIVHCVNTWISTARLLTIEDWENMLSYDMEYLTK